MDCTIANVSAHALSSPIEPPQERSFDGGVRRLHKRDMVLVVVETPDGERGYAPAGASSSAMREHFEGTTQRDFAALVEGRVAAALEGTTVDLSDHTNLVGAVPVEGALASQIAGAIDVACHDVVGKRRGAPIYELLGDTGDPDPLPLYASAGMYQSPEAYASQAATLESLGFVGYKYRPGIGPDGDVETIEAIAAATGEAFAVMADAHTWWKLGEEGYTDSDRDRIVDAYASHDLFWLEEPVEPSDHGAYAALGDGTSVPLAGGESEPDVEGLIELRDAVDFLQGDVRHHAGFAGCLAAAEACRGHPTRFVPHNFGTLLGLVANAHLVAGIDGDLLEYPIFEDDPFLDAETDPGMYPNPLAFDIIDDDLTIEDGTLAVPDGPGLGVTVNTDVIEDYPFREGAWTTFEYE